MGYAAVSSGADVEFEMDSGTEDGVDTKKAQSPMELERKRSLGPQ
jgi:hypothetical protein